MSVTAPKGVSVSFLEFFLSKKLKNKTWTTSEVLTHVVAPETKQKKCAYYTLYEKTKDSKGSFGTFSFHFSENMLPSWGTDQKYVAQTKKKNEL